MRVFLAVELPPAVQEELGVVQQALAASRADVKWVEPRHLHLTLRFLGEITEDQRRTVEHLTSQLAADSPAVSLRVSVVGAFPSAQAPRVVWAGIEQGREHLARMAERVEEGLVQAGFAREERAFAAHVTLGRVRSSRRRLQLTQQMTQLTWDPPPPFVVDHLTLFQSHLSPAGPTYVPLARFTLRAPSSAPII